MGIDAVPEVFRQAGYHVVRMVDVFGADQMVPDVEWIAWAGARGMGAATKDKKIRRRPREKEAVVQGALRLLCLSSGGLGTEGQAEAFARQMRGIDRLWLAPGPWIYSVSLSALQPVDL